MSTNQKPPSRTAEQFVVRFPDGMRDRIAEAAKANNRSMNAEIVARLEQTFISAAYDSDGRFTADMREKMKQALSDLIIEITTDGKRKHATHVRERAEKIAAARGEAADEAAREAGWDDKRAMAAYELGMDAAIREMELERREVNKSK